MARTISVGHVVASLETIRAIRVTDDLDVLNKIDVSLAVSVRGTLPPSFESLTEPCATCSILHSGSLGAWTGAWLAKSMQPARDSTCHPITNPGRPPRRERRRGTGRINKSGDDLPQNRAATPTHHRLSSPNLLAGSDSWSSVHRRPTAGNGELFCLCAYV